MSATQYLHNSYDPLKTMKDVFGFKPFVAGVDGGNYFIISAPNHYDPSMPSWLRIGIKSFSRMLHRINPKIYIFKLPMRSEVMETSNTRSANGRVF